MQKIGTKFDSFDDFNENLKRFLWPKINLKAPFRLTFFSKNHLFSTEKNLVSFIAKKASRFPIRNNTLTIKTGVKVLNSNVLIGISYRFNLRK